VYFYMIQINLTDKGDSNVKLGLDHHFEMIKLSHNEAVEYTDIMNTKPIRVL